MDSSRSDELGSNFSINSAGSAAFSEPGGICAPSSEQSVGEISSTSDYGSLLSITSPCRPFRGRSSMPLSFAEPDSATLAPPEDDFSAAHHGANLRLQEALSKTSPHEAQKNQADNSASFTQYELLLKDWPKEQMKLDKINVQLQPDQERNYNYTSSVFLTNRYDDVKKVQECDGAKIFPPYPPGTYTGHGFQSFQNFREQPFAQGYYIFTYARKIFGGTIADCRYKLPVYDVFRAVNGRSQEKFTPLDLVAKTPANRDKTDVRLGLYFVDFYCKQPSKDETRSAKCEDKLHEILLILCEVDTKCDKYCSQYFYRLGKENPFFQIRFDRNGHLRIRAAHSYSLKIFCAFAINIPKNLVAEPVTESSQPCIITPQAKRTNASRQSSSSNQQPYYRTGNRDNPARDSNRKPQRGGDRPLVSPKSPSSAQYEHWTDVDTDCPRCNFIAEN